MTTWPTDHDAWRDQAALYVLGAQTPAERAAFDAHLAACSECAADVRSMTDVVGALAYAAPEVEPPAALRDQVLASIGAAERGPAVVVPMRPRRTALAIPWLAAAASVVVAVGLGAHAVALRGRIDALDVRLREAVLRADASERQMADARRMSFQAQAQVAVLAAPDLARVDLAGQPVAPAASGRAFWSRSRGVVFTASNLPPLAAGRTYQLWVVTAQAPVSAGLLKPDAAGRITAVFDTAPDLPRAVAMAVTIEPEGGVPAPTGDKYLVGLITS